MKYLKLIIAFTTLFNITSQLSAVTIEQQLQAQIKQLQYMLAQSNDAYIYYTTPMYKQWLTLHWFLQYIMPFSLLQGEHSYNAEIILSESKKLADIIIAMEKLREIQENNK